MLIAFVVVIIIIIITIMHIWVCLKTDEITAVVAEQVETTIEIIRGRMFGLVKSVTSVVPVLCDVWRITLLENSCLLTLCVHWKVQVVQQQEGV